MRELVRKPTTPPCSGLSGVAYIEGCFSVKSPRAPTSCIALVIGCLVCPARCRSICLPWIHVIWTGMRASAGMPSTTFKLWRFGRTRVRPRSPGLSPGRPFVPCPVRGTTWSVITTRSSPGFRRVLLCASVSGCGLLCRGLRRESSGRWCVQGPPHVAVCAPG